MRSDESQQVKNTQEIKDVFDCTKSKKVKLCLSAARFNPGLKKISGKGNKRAFIYLFSMNYKNTNGENKILKPFHVPDITTSQYIFNHIHKLRFLYFEVYRLNTMEYVKICLCVCVWIHLIPQHFVLQTIMMPVLSRNNHLTLYFFVLHFNIFF